MSDIEEKRIETDIPSPIFSATSSTSSTSDSDSASSDGQRAPEDMLDDLEQEEKSLLIQDDDDEDDGEIENEGNLVMFGRALPRSPRSTTPIDMEEQRAPSTDYPQSQRIYSSPSCGISAVLQRQCNELWMQFDSIGTEMIVTRRGR